MNAIPQPQPVAAIDADFRRRLKGLHRLRWWALLAAGIIVATAMTVGAIVIMGQNNQLRSYQQQLAAQQRELRVTCGWWQALAGAPLMQTGSKPPGELGVQLVFQSRVAFLGIACGTAPANPTLDRWARYYHLHA